LATEAGWLIGIFFAAYVVAVPLLLALTDRVAVKRIYLLGTGLTALSHLGFAVIADGFWIGLLLCALAGIGWAGTYMTGLKALADHLDTEGQSRAVSWHAAGAAFRAPGISETQHVLEFRATRQVPMSLSRARIIRGMPRERTGPRNRSGRVTAATKFSHACRRC
jgi:hypothetical protein